MVTTAVKPRTLALPMRNAVPAAKTTFMHRSLHERGLCAASRALDRLRGEHHRVCTHQTTVATAAEPTAAPAPRTNANNAVRASR